MALGVEENFTSNDEIDSEKALFSWSGLHTGPASVRTNVPTDRDELLMYSCRLQYASTILLPLATLKQTTKLGESLVPYIIPSTTKYIHQNYNLSCHTLAIVCMFAPDRQ